MPNVLSSEKRAQLVSCLVEGMSIRATARICDVAFNTVLSFVPLIGKACSDYQDSVLRGLTCKRLELDETWAPVYAKDKNLPPDKRGVRGYGSAYTWIALDSETKLVPTWFVGDRSAASAFLFLHDLKTRLVNRPQIITDGHAAYMSEIENVFGDEVDFARIIKIFGSGQAGNSSEARYSPPKCTGIEKHLVRGTVPEGNISTSYVERFNLSLRMHNRRFTRLTNAHSKKLENHVHSLSLFMMFYNFARRHDTLRVSPAMAAGVTNHLWDVREIVALLNEPAARAEGAA